MANDLQFVVVGCAGFFFCARADWSARPVSLSNLDVLRKISAGERKGREREGEGKKAAGGGGGGLKNRAGRPLPILNYSHR